MTAQAYWISAFSLNRVEVSQAEEPGYGRTSVESAVAAMRETGIDAPQVAFTRDVQESIVLSRWS